MKHFMDNENDNTRDMHTGWNRLRLLFLFVALIMLLTVLSACCKHENTALINYVDSTCTEDGYSGDLWCDDCEKIIKKGEILSAKGHLLSEPIGVKEVSCATEGYTGDVYCSVCGTLVTKGKVLEKLSHTRGELQWQREATCAEEGYTGDVLCTVCGEAVIQGEIIPKLEHSFRDIGNATESTCVSHGYSGDRECTVCGYVEYGEELNYTDHVYKDHICTICGWMTPGLYIDNVYTMTWDELKANGYITVNSKGQLTGNSGNFQNGRLVVGEDVTYLDCNYYIGTKNSTIGELWLPRSITKLGSYIGHDCSSLHKIVLYCQVKTIPSSGFKYFNDDSALETLILPDCVETIEREAFTGHPNLKEIHWPANLKYIGRDAFRNCGLTGNLVLPDSVETLEHDAFCGSKVYYVTLPTSLTEFEGAFDNCKQLAVVDGSLATQLKSMKGFCECPSLETLLLPPNLESMEGWYMGGGFLRKCPLLTYLEIPDSVRYCNRLLNYSSVETIVFPTGLIDIGDNSGTVKEIRYRGTEQQWKMTTASTRFTNVKIKYKWDEYLVDEKIRVSNSNISKIHQSEESEYGIPSIDSISGDHEYVYIDGEGNGEQISAISSLLKGKIAISNRGGISFADKANSAAKAGALAVIIIDNGDNGFGWMDLSEVKYKIPVILVHSSYKTKIIQYGEEQNGYNFDVYTGTMFIGE